MFSFPSVPTIGFVPDVYNVNEDDGNVNFIIEVIQGTLERDVEVVFTTQPGTATEDGESCDLDHSDNIIHIQSCKLYLYIFKVIYNISYI